MVSKFSRCPALSPNTLTVMFPKTSSRVGELGFNMVWILEKFGNGRPRKFERLGLIMKISRSVLFIGGLP